MWTYTTINLVVTLGVLAAGLIGFAAGWITHRSVARERKETRNDTFDSFRQMR
ncbi:MAG: hypothetical protein AAF661_01270 [Pseudomonadota bacterium]